MNFSFLLFQSQTVLVFFPLSTENHLFSSVPTESNCLVMGRGVSVWFRLEPLCSVTAHLLKCMAVLQKQPHSSQSNGWAGPHRLSLQIGVLSTCIFL